MPTILVVDDDADVLAITSHVLSSEGHRVLSAPSGEAALELLEREGSIDLILTDIVMPGMNGFELATRAKQERADLRVLYMSGYYRTTAPLPDWAFDEGRVLRKPWRVEELKKEVRLSLGL